jgi:hypothetical protein
LKLALVAVIAAALLATAPAPAAPQTNEEATAQVSVSKRYARRLLRRYIRDNAHSYQPGSIYVTDCQRGYTRAGWPRVICHEVSWDTRDFRTWCGWGKVVEKRSYFTYKVYVTREC